MIVTKKLWLDWGYDDDTPCDTLGWTYINPITHNGIIEKGTELVLANLQNEIEGESQYVSFEEKGIQGIQGSGPNFTMEELFKFIKDGTFQLKDGK